MFPAFPMTNQTCGRSRNSELAFNRSIFNVSIHEFSNFENVTVCKRALIMRFSTRCFFKMPLLGVIDVLLARYVFQIIRAVVLPVVIPMIDFISIRAWTYKRPHNQPMNSNCFNGKRRTFGQNDSKIPVFFVNPKRKKSTDFCPHCFSVSPYTPQIGNRIKALPTRNWFPNFVCAINGISHIVNLLHGRLERLWDSQSHAARSLYCLKGH